MPHFRRFRTGNAQIDSVQQQCYTPASLPTCCPHARRPVSDRTARPRRRQTAPAAASRQSSTAGHGRSALPPRRHAQNARHDVDGLQQPARVNPQRRAAARRIALAGPARQPARRQPRAAARSRAHAAARRARRSRSEPPRPRVARFRSTTSSSSTPCASSTNRWRSASTSPASPSATSTRSADAFAAWKRLPATTSASGRASIASFTSRSLAHAGDRLMRTIRELYDHADRYRWLYIKGVPRALSIAADEHKAIFEASAERRCRPRGGPPRPPSRANRLDRAHASRARARSHDRAGCDPAGDRRRNARARAPRSPQSARAFGSASR